MIQGRCVQKSKLCVDPCPARQIVALALAHLEYLEEHSARVVSMFDGYYLGPKPVALNIDYPP